ncbi:Carboxylate/amino_acid/amine transporter family protein [Hexamita inflata]|uniref:Carboxylate/amino acid/amine transporter family protein n=1 Tax=Hexamita inflata TaxID=28002 RepID=A0AA86RCY1_9EUKA|nr:Carboxylate/amino acid/amine transporter family protein [Hexamita inflata]
MSKIALFGLSQGIAVLNCLIGIVLQVINTNYNTNVPIFLQLVFYSLQLCFLVYGPSRQKTSTRQMWLVLLFGVFDVSANFCINFAYNYTNVISVILLTSLATPFSMIFSYFILGSRFTVVKILLIFTSIAFAFAYSLLDSQQGESRVWGNVLATLGSLGYGINTTLNEYLLKSGLSVWQILPRIAIVGITATIIGCLSLETTKIKNLGHVFWLVLLFAVLLTSFYLLQMYSIKKTSAVFVNASVLTTNFYTFLFGIIFLQGDFQFVQLFPALFLVVTVFVFEIAE